MLSTFKSSRTFIPIGASARRCGSTEGSARIRTSTISRRVCAATQILYLEDTIDKDDLLGFHNLHFSGIPFGFVFTEISGQMGEPWQVTLSHEALELIADAEVNRLIMGPHPDPAQKGRMVFHWYEMCDAVQAERYEINGVPVSNFVLPLYFTVDSEQGGRNDFLATVRSDGSRLPSFGINPGGYVGFYDPDLDDHDTYFADALTNAPKSNRSSASRGAALATRVRSTSRCRAGACREAA